MSKLPVGLQVYSVRWQAEADFEKTAKEIKDMGYDFLELAGLYDYSADEIVEILDRVGIKALSAHVPISELLEDTVGTLKKYKKIGCEYVVVPYYELDKKINEAVVDIEMIGKKAKELGLTLLYHNHDFEFNKMDDGKYYLDYLYENISADYLQTELDTCWVNVGGENPVDYINKYKGRCPVVHLKDFLGSKSEGMYELIGDSKTKAKETNAFRFTPVGEGKQNFAAILDAAEKCGAKYVVVEQDNPYELTGLEAAKISRDNLKKLGW